MRRSNPPPIHALAHALRNAISEQARTEAAEIYLAGFLDGYVSLAVGPCVRVSTLYDETIPTLAYVTVFGPASSAKSPMSKLFKEHFDAYVAAYVVATAEVWQEYEADKEAWKAQKAGVLKSIKKHAASGHPPDACLLQRLTELEKNPPKLPPSAPACVGDTTLASWVEQVARNPVVLFFVDEGGSVLANMEKDLIGALCSFWSGMSFSYARSHMGTQAVVALATEILSIQDNVYANFLASPKGQFYIGSGKASRSLHYGVHASDFAQQAYSDSEVHDRTALKVVLERAEYFFRLQDQLNKDGWKNRKTLELTQPAKREAQDIDRYLHGLRRNAGSAGELAVIDKALQNIFRHAARHHEFAGIDGNIEASEIADSAEWVLWSLDNYVELTEHGQTSGRNVERDAETLRNMLYRLRVRNGKITKRRLSEEAFNVGLVRSTHVNDALGLLCQEGLATLKDGHVYWDSPTRLGRILGKGGIY